MAESFDAQPTCRFYVEFGSKAEAVFSEVGGLQVELEVFDYAEGGNNGFVHRRPGRAKASNLTLKRGMTRSQELMKWCLAVAAGTIERRNLSVVLYDPAGKPLVRWDFKGAYPVKWSGPQLAADGKTAAIETLELAHEGITLG